MIQPKAKYETIVDWVSERLSDNTLKAGEKIESENELATIFHVSRQTVRHAISILETQGILERKRGSGTFVKGDEKVKITKPRTMRIGIVTTYVDEYIFPPMIKAMERILSSAGYTIQIVFTHNSIETERAILQKFLQNTEVDGIIAETVRSGLPNPNIDFYKQLLEKGIPTVFINSYYEALHVPHVSMDDKLAGKTATKYLMKCGHRKIGGIFKSDDGQGRLRYLGYAETLLEGNVQVKSNQIAWIDTEDMNGTLADFSRVLKRLKECTACVCYNDEVANKLVAVCVEKGIKIPEELSIVGIDNSELASLCEVPFTSVENPIQEVGKKAAEGIMTLIEGKRLEERLELRPQLVTRNSVKIISDLTVEEH